MSQSEITTILDLHKKWLNDEPGGERANLSGANLNFSNLRGAYLRDAYLCDAYLRDAILRGANLRGADLRGADLREANLSDADLRGADLSGAVLFCANLSGVKFPESLKFTPDPTLLKKVAEAALAGENCLEMGNWHTCETTHCIAGWAVHLHPDGKRLEENSSSYLAGRLLLGDEAAKHFFDSNTDAAKWLKTQL